MVQAPCFASHRVLCFGTRSGPAFTADLQSTLPQHPSKLPSNPAIHSTFPHFHTPNLEILLQYNCDYLRGLTADRVGIKKKKINRDYSFANSQHRVSAPRNDVDAEPLVRTASVSWFLCSSLTHQRLISFRTERSRCQCPLDIDKLIKMDEWQPRIFADGKVSSGVIYCISPIYTKPICVVMHFEPHILRFLRPFAKNWTPYEIIAETQNPCLSNRAVLKCCYAAVMLRLLNTCVLAL